MMVEGVVSLGYRTRLFLNYEKQEYFLKIGEYMHSADNMFTMLLEGMCVEATVREQP